MAKKSIRKWSAVGGAAGLVLSSSGFASAQTLELERRIPTGGAKIALSRCEGGDKNGELCKAEDNKCVGGTCPNRSTVELVVNLAQKKGADVLGWGLSLDQRVALKERFDAINRTIAGATDGQIVLGRVIVVEGNGAPEAIVQLAPGTCSGGTNDLCVYDEECGGNNKCQGGASNKNRTVGEWGSRGKIEVDVVCVGEPRCFSKQFMSLVGNLRDEQQGNFLPISGIASCEGTPSKTRCFGGPKNGQFCPSGSSSSCGNGGECKQIGCVGNLDSGGHRCLMEWSDSQSVVDQDSLELCFDGIDGNHDPDRDTEQSLCRQNHSCWTQFGLEWPSVIRVPHAAADIQSGDPPNLKAVDVRFETPVFDRFVAVVDRSGSMDIVENGQSRLHRAVEAVQDFIAMLSDRSQFGLVSFANVYGNPIGMDATKDFPKGIPGLKTMSTDDDRALAMVAADELKIRGGGLTRIGAGLRLARDILLENNGNLSINSAVLLLTDGLNNQPEDDPQADLDDALDKLSNDHQKVFVSCIGEARDSAQCSKISDRTAGRFVDSPTSEGLYDAFVEFVALAENNGIAQTQMGVPISQNELSAPIPVVIEEGGKEARFIVSWTRLKSDLDLKLFRPDGTLVPASERVFGTQGEFYRIDNPTPGTWTMQVYGAFVPEPDGSSSAVSTPDNFSARALIDHQEINVEAGLALSTITWPTPFLVNAAPSFGLSIANCQAAATIQKPDGSSETIPLLDEGENGDSKAHDGFYNALYRNFTAGDGIYTFLVRVRCERGLAHVANDEEANPGEEVFDPEIPTFERTIRFSGIMTGFPSNPNDPDSPNNLTPVAQICHDIEAECQGPMTPVVLDGTCSFDPEGSALSYMWSSPTGSFSVTTGPQPTGHFPLGQNTVQLEVADASAAVSLPDVGLAVVADTTAPAIQAITASPSTLWPPNHHMAPVTLTVQAIEACDPNYACQITSVTSNEKPECDDDGNPQADWEITGPLSLKLRKESGKKKKERIYTVSVTCTDASGNQSTAPVTIAVTHKKED